MELQHFLRRASPGDLFRYCKGELWLFTRVSGTEAWVLEMFWAPDFRNARMKPGTSTVAFEVPRRPEWRLSSG